MNLNVHQQKNKQRILVSCILTAVTIINLQSQFPEKTLIVGGEINIPLLSEYEDGSKHYYFNPKVGYFLLDNLALGLNVETSIYTLDNNRRTELGAGPLVRYYYKKNRVYGFAHFSYLANLILFNTATRDEYQSKIQPGVGIGYMLSPSVGIDAFFLYNFFNTNDEYADRLKYKSSSINIGFQIYFPTKDN